MEVTTEQQTAALVAFKNISALLHNGMFLGAHSQYVGDAIRFIDQLVAEQEAKAAAPTPQPTSSKGKKK